MTSIPATAALLPTIASTFKYAALFLVSLVFLLGVGAPTNLSSTFAWQFRAAARLRTPILVFLVVPLSFVRWVYGEIRGRVRDFVRRSRRLGEDEIEEGHRGRVEKVVEQIREWNDSGRRSKLRTARPTWMGMSVHISGKEGSHRIEVGHLNHILSVNDSGSSGEGKKADECPSVTVEPGVTMGDLTRRLLPLGLMLDLHIEMESVTVGGAAMGFGIETNSHSSGFFQETVLAYEIVDSNGNIRKVERDSLKTAEEKELFHALPWSHGSIGFLTRLIVKCVRVKPYVNVRYIPTRSAEELTSKLRDFTEGDKCPRFVEATVFSRDNAVIQLGDYCTLEDAPSNVEVHEINHFWKPFYYRYVESLMNDAPMKGDEEGACRSELVPLKHYAHRFTRSVFWELEDMIPFSNHPLYRCLWGWLGAPEVGLLKLAQGPVIRQASVEAHVVQESIAPLKNLAECIEGFDEWFGVYPLLAFPVRVRDRDELSGFLRPRTTDLLPGKDYGMYVDLGAYGVPRPVKVGQPWHAKPNIRFMEDWTRERGGFQALYTDVFHTRREFRDMFDHTLLDRVRSRPGIDARGAFAEVYDRIKSRYADLEEEERMEREQSGQEEERSEGVVTKRKVDSNDAALVSSDQIEEEDAMETDQSSKASSSSNGSRSVVAKGGEVPSSVGDVWQWISGVGGKGLSRPPSPVSESTNASESSS